MSWVQNRSRCGCSATSNCSSPDERGGRRRGGRGQLGLDPRLDRREAQLAQSARLGRRERGLGDVGVRLATPLTQGLAQPPGGQRRADRWPGPGGPRRPAARTWRHPPWTVRRPAGSPAARVTTTAEASGPPALARALRRRETYDATARSAPAGGREPHRPSTIASTLTTWPADRVSSASTDRATPWTSTRRAPRWISIGPRTDRRHSARRAFERSRSAVAIPASCNGPSRFAIRENDYSAAPRHGWASVRAHVAVAV